MPGLIDIAEIVEQAEVRGQPIETRGIEVEKWATLIARFPDFRKMAETGKWDAVELAKISGPALNAIVAAGFPEYITEKTAANLKLGEKVELIGKIIKATVGPRGIRPFVELMDELGLTDLLVALNARFALGLAMTSQTLSPGLDSTDIPTPENIRLAS